ncbi:MAG: TraR/DksA family transcriptional regulator [Endomicrobium sp.]|jgi:DnaK suppressor protein|nr:TraR/DksA family transcriptional regulator [Endomicrobium sp.]
MKKIDLLGLKKILIQKKTELLNKSNNSHGRMNIDSGINDVGDEIDTASQNSEREMYFELVANDKMTLNAVDDAIVKIEKSVYGKCECCRDVIPLKRLKAIPWTRYCIQCQEKLENPQK